MTATVALPGVAVPGVAASAAPIPVTVRSVAPSATDPAIDDRYGEHYVAVGPATLRNGKMLVFFAGTGGRPDDYSQFLIHAAKRGYLAVGLAYPNDLSINGDVCAGQPAQCKEDTRLEILLGASVVNSPWLYPNISDADAAYHRLVRLVANQAAAYPAEGWGGLLVDPATPRWGSIAFAGHSQGGGHAAMTGKINTVDRAVLFDATEPAAWTQEPKDTPSNRFWGLAHEREDPFESVTRSWQLLGIPGELFIVDGQAPPFGGSHQLVSTTTACTGDPGDSSTWHQCVIADQHLPTGATLTHLKTVWNHLLAG
ncbi:MAG TPA: hypothetical protein VFC19_29445 [Candidatus Limnocylindrales bacterium]|nr:hypothetical protein [Candidatus Limnocylindrales bacterium]